MEIATIFNDQIEASLSGNETRIKVVQAETGTGKTQGLALYCSMLPEDVGVLIITRMKRQADDLADLINNFAGKEIAVARHGDNKLTSEQTNDCQVLVITHKAFEMSLDLINQGREAALSSTMTWAEGERMFTVIDEALDVIRISQAELDELTRVIGCIPSSIRKDFPKQINALAQLQESLEEIADAQENEHRKGAILREHAREDLEDFDMTELRRAVKGVEWDRIIGCSRSLRERQKIATRIDKTLQSAQALAESWAYYAKEGVQHSLSTSSCIIPDEFSNVIILDATASSNLIYDLLGSVDIPALPKARDYSNVTLHTARVTGVGKTKMTTKAKKRTAALVSNLQENLSSDKSVFVCCHKDVEPHLKGYDLPFDQFETGHWGAIDGRNDWQEFDTAVIFGLPYMSPSWPLMTYAATRGLPSQSWIDNGDERRFKKHKDVNRALEVGQLVTSIIQTINRVRCRRVIDKDGNCDPTDIFILLPKGKKGDKILKGIVKEMPNIVVQKWSFNFGTKSKKRLRKSDHEEALITYARNMYEGEVSAKELREELGIPLRSWERLVKKLKDKSSELFRQLRSLGVTFNSTFMGRGSRSYLSKS